MKSSTTLKDARRLLHSAQPLALLLRGHLACHPNIGSLEQCKGEDAADEYAHYKLSTVRKEK